MWQRENLFQQKFWAKLQTGFSFVKLETELLKIFYFKVCQNVSNFSYDCEINVEVNCENGHKQKHR